MYNDNKLRNVTQRITKHRQKQACKFMSCNNISYHHLISRLQWCFDHYCSVSFGAYVKKGAVQ